MEVLDLFSGAGGLSLGFEQTGATILAAFDNDKDSVATFNANHKDKVCEETDIFDLVNSSELNQFNGIDLIMGGPPCQGFCAINPSRHVDDPRNSCLDAFLDTVKSIKPRMVLIENVTGLVSLGSGFAIKKLTTFFTENKYNYNFKVLQAAHYGVPQSRWRFILVASHDKTDILIEPTHLAQIRPNFKDGKKLTFNPQEDLFSQSLLPFNTVYDAISDLPELENGGEYTGRNKNYLPTTDYQKGLNNGSSIINNHKTRKLDEVNLDRVKYLKKPGMNWHDLPDNMMPNNLRKLKNKYGSGGGTQTRFKRLKWDDYFSTILTSPDPYWGAFIHPSQHRVLSVRECARAQSFPDNFVFHGSMTSAYRQIGNAVPPILAKKIAEHLIK